MDCASFPNLAGVRSSSLKALLLSLFLHSAVILSIFLAGMTFRPVPVDLSPLVVSITPLSDGHAASGIDAPSGRATSRKSASLEASRLTERTANPDPIATASPPMEPAFRNADASQLSAVPGHDHQGSVRQNLAREGSGASEPASKSGKMTSSGAIPQYGGNPLPVYPSMARKMGYEGIVMLAAEILSDGRVGQLVIKKSSGFSVLDQSALDAVKKWKFIPARWMGRPVSVWVDVPVKFRLSES